MLFNSQVLLDQTAGQIVNLYVTIGRGNENYTVLSDEVVGVRGKLAYIRAYYALL